MKVVYNGELVDIANSPASQSGWLPGSGIFETIKTVDNVAYALSRHMKRAQRSAAEIDMQIPNEAEIVQKVAQLVHALPHPNGLLRISFSANSDWLIAHLPYEVSDKALKVRIHPVAITGDCHKRFPYDSRLIIMEEARVAGYDDAITMNPQANICEGSVTNLIVRIDNQWLTPPVSDGLLPGIMRELLIENDQVEVQTISIKEIPHITSAFFLSSLRIAQPLASIGEHQLQASHAFGLEIHALAHKYSVG